MPAVYSFLGRVEWPSGVGFKSSCQEQLGFKAKASQLVVDIIRMVFLSRSSVQMQCQFIVESSSSSNGHTLCATLSRVGMGSLKDYLPQLMRRTNPLR
jgi:hypothetical protein